MDGRSLGESIGNMIGCLFVAAIVGGIGTLAGLVFFFLWLLGWV